MDLISTHVCMTKDVGIHGNLFGGNMMSYIDEAAAAYSCMYCDTPRMVTVKVSELVFQRPVKPGQLIRLYGEVKNVGNTSITLHIVVKKHDPATGEEKITTETDIVFVKIDEDGEPTSISNRIKEKFKKTNTLLTNEKH